MFNSVWSAALSVALGVGPAHQPTPQPVYVAQAPPRAVQPIAPTNHRPMPPRLLQHQAAAPIVPQYYQAAPTAPQFYAAPGQVRYYYVAPQQFQGVIQASGEVPVNAPQALIPVEAPLPTPAPVAVPVPEPVEGGINGYLHEISSYVGPSGFRTYNYTQVSTSEEAIGDEDVAAAGEAGTYENEDSLRKHLTQIGATAYAAELARLRARQDFEQLNKISATVPTAIQSTTIPQAAIQIVPPPAPSPLPVDQLQTVQQAAPQIAPLNYQQDQPRVEQMKQQIEQQQLRLNALQKALDRQPAQRPAVAPKPKKKGLIHHLFD